jgi:bifunctional UDP-N-acetylglucosamine pyrophosphorylase/glucosamine-1-phosphate N-acetyltransferase
MRCRWPGVNSPLQLAELERAAPAAPGAPLMEQGVRLADPARLTCAPAPAALVCGQDVEIDVNCVFDRPVELGEGVRIGANCCIANAPHRGRRGDPPLHPHRRRKGRCARWARAR